MPNQKFEDLSFKEKTQIIQALALFPALTLMVFLRRRLGFRLMKPAWLLIMTLIMCFAAFQAPDALTRPHGWTLIIFAIAMLGLGMFQRWRRWVELCAGVRWHTYCSGISWLESLPLPGFLFSHRRIYRILDPLIGVVLGMVASLTLSGVLGLWITLSALCLYIYEQAVYEMALERDLDTLDGLFAAEVQAEVVKHFEGPQPGEKLQKLEDTAGIPTGIAPDIHKQIEVRRAKRDRLVPPDNFAAA